MKKLLNILVRVVALAFGTRVRNWLILTVLHRAESGEIERQSGTVRAQADHVRQILSECKQHPQFAQITENMFPEISSTLEDCVICEKPVLLRIHPDVLCYECWLEEMSAIQQGMKNVSAGMDPQEAMRLLEERLEKLLPAES